MINILDYIKKHCYIFITLLLGIIIVISIFILNDVSPFGKNSLLTIDFFHQYGPMLAEFYDRIHSGETLIYSFNTGLGIPFFRTFLNYMSSPLNILIFLFKRNNLLMSYSFIIGLRSIISSLTLVYCLRKKFNTNNLSFIGLGLLYAYSAYFAAYYWNIMWLDGMIFLPLIALGIENIINRNNGFLYTISLTLMLYSNYFIGYMLCIFSCIYFIAYLVIKTDKFDYKMILKQCILFAICSLISGALNAWALIPMYDALKTTNATVGSMPTSQYYAFTIMNFFKNHLTGVTSTVLSTSPSNIPNISSGILSVALFFMFLLTNKISLKRKIVYTSILAFLLLSFYIAPLDYIWHAFHVPNDLPFRYSFIYTFILIITNAYALKNIKDISFIKVVISYIISLIFINFVYLTNFQNISNNMIIFNYALISIYFIIYLLYHFFPRFKKLEFIMFVIVIAVECIISVNHNWEIDQKIDDFYYDYNSITRGVEIIKQNDNSLFYRTEKNNNLTYNDGSWYDYYGQTIFSSMAYNSLSELNNNLGMPGNYINSYYYKQNTPVYDLMFNIKYQIGLNNDKFRYQLIENMNDMQIHKFKYTTGLMFGVDENIKKLDAYNINPFENQNEFVKLSTGIENVLYKLELNDEYIISSNDSETIVRQTYLTNEENVYIYAPDVNYIIVNDSIYYKGNLDLTSVGLINNVQINNYYIYDESFVINEISNDNTIDIYVSSYENNLDNLYVYSMSHNRFIDTYNILKENEVNITNFKENLIEGEITLNESKSIYTSIPYDKGWKVYSNGNEIETYAINDSLLGFDLNKGSNSIVLKYTPPYLYLGIAISSITAILLGIYLIKIKK